MQISEHSVRGGPAVERERRIRERDESQIWTQGTERCAASLWLIVHCSVRGSCNHLRPQDRTDFSVDELFFGEKLKGTRMCMADCDDFGWMAEILDHEVEPVNTNQGWYELVRT